MINCPMCGKEFKNRRGYSSHMRKHKGRDKKATKRYIDVLLKPIPPSTSVQRVEMLLSPEGNLKITIEKEQVGTEEELRL